MIAAAPPPELPAGLGHLRAARPLHGGSICAVWAGALDDGTAVVVKRAPYDVTAEVDGLEALAAAGAPVPDVLAADDDLLVLSRVDGDPDWHGLGRRVAALHRDSAGERFGWHRDNLLGTATQPGGWSSNWPAFFADHRLRPLLDSEALPATVRRRLERGIDGPLRELLGAHNPRASLVHGDLWSGNVVAGRWLIDPAVWMADRELELAFTTLFGGVPRAFFDGYATAWPLPADAGERRPALQLYHLLIHVWHFGASYVGMVVDRLDRLGWH
ncbi:MAG: fructosamine kinase family protein [Actinobacteria bacterium]|nr:fructosamine kinase family protein [Actinomycetota bacterium]